MRFYKSISIILHPIVIPTIGIMLYFLLIPNNFSSNQRLNILSLIFVVTYLIPLLMMVVLKKTRVIRSYKVKTIKERKLPIGIMIMIFYLLGNAFNRSDNFSDIGLLFLSTSLGLFVIYLLFYFKIKASIHLLSMGISTSFFMVLSNIYSLSFTIVIIILFILSGLLASARLHLIAHSVKEVYLGFFIGAIATFSLYYIL
jgi:hypothetical protein